MQRLTPRRVANYLSDRSAMRYAMYEHSKLVDSTLSDNELEH